MTDTQQFTDAHLHAFVDNQLDEIEYAQMLEAISKDSNLALLVNNIRQDVDLLKLAYNDVPHPPRKPASYVSNFRSLAIAASLFIALGYLIGISVSNIESPNPTEINSPAFSSIDNFTPAKSAHRKIMIHVSKNNVLKYKRALDKVENILKYSQNNNHAIELVVVANAAGLSLLRKNSPFQDRISSLSQQYSNLKFKACGIAVENARLKEGVVPRLLPEAIKVPNALGEILNNLKAGWIYLKS